MYVVLLRGTFNDCISILYRLGRTTMNPWNPWNRWIMNMKAMKRVRHILNLQHFKNIQVCIESFHMTIPHLILLPYDPMRNCEDTAQWKMLNIPRVMPCGRFLWPALCQLSKMPRLKEALVHTLGK